MTLLEELHRLCNQYMRGVKFEVDQIVDFLDDRYRDMLWDWEKMGFVLDIPEQGKVYFTTARIIWEKPPDFTETECEEIEEFLTDRFGERDWCPVVHHYLELADVMNISPIIGRREVETVGYRLPLIVAAENGEYGKVIMDSGLPIVELRDILIDYQRQRTNLINTSLRKLLHQRLLGQTTGSIYAKLSFAEQTHIVTKELKGISIDELGRILCYWNMKNHHILLGVNGFLFVDKHEHYSQFMACRDVEKYAQKNAIFSEYPLIKVELVRLANIVLEVINDKKSLMETIIR